MILRYHSSDGILLSFHTAHALCARGSLAFHPKGAHPLQPHQKYYTTQYGELGFS